MIKIKAKADSTAFFPLFSLQSTILTRIGMRTEYRNRCYWWGEWVVKGSSAREGNCQGIIISQQVRWTDSKMEGPNDFANSQLWQPAQKIMFWGETFHTAKINCIAMGLITAKLLPHDIIGFPTNAWFHTTHKFCICFVGFKVAFCLLSWAESTRSVCLGKALEDFQQ